MEQRLRSADVPAVAPAAPAHPEWIARHRAAVVHLRGLRAQGISAAGGALAASAPEYRDRGQRHGRRRRELAFRPEDVPERRRRSLRTLHTGKWREPSIDGHLSDTARERR